MINGSRSELTGDRACREVNAAWGDMAMFAHINHKYAPEMRFETVPDSCERFGLTFPVL